MILLILSRVKVAIIIMNGITFLRAMIQIVRCGNGCIAG